MLGRIFRNRFGHWRAGWRLVLYLLCAAPLAWTAVWVLGLATGGPGGGAFGSWRYSVLWSGIIVALVLPALALLRWLDRRPPALLGLGFEAGWLREIAWGLAAGVLLTTALTLALLAGGWVRVEVTDDLAASLAALPPYALFFTLAAAVEELVFRGYPLQVLAEGSRRWLAGLVLCLLFTWAHVGNPDVTLVGITNIFLAAVVLTVLYFQTRRLWLPVAFHMSWNLGQSWLWGFDVSGIEVEARLLEMTPTGSEILNGGGFGLEGSVLTLGLFVVLTVWLLVARPLRPSPAVRSAWARFPQGFGVPPAASDSSADPEAVPAPPGERRADVDGAGRDADPSRTVSGRSTR